MWSLVVYRNFLMFSMLFFLFCKQSTSANQCKDKYRVFPGHSACLKRSSKCVRTGSVNKEEVLGVHNKYRLMAAQKYHAKNILNMIWDDEVAMVAQRWAENCHIGHDGNSQRIIPGRFTVGQNIASSEYEISWETVVQLFYNETKDFVFGSTTNILEKIGHFTQLTWADSYILGCGYAVCDKTHFYVCNYAPSGNHLDDLGHPFSTTGQTVTLYDCKQKMCEGGSRLDPFTCQCLCLRDYYNNTLNYLKSSSNNCKLTCVKNIKEKFFCGSEGYGEESCLSMSNVPFDCPKTCHVCPYADENYTEGSEPVVTLRSSEIPLSTSRLVQVVCITVFLFLRNI